MHQQFAVFDNSFLIGIQISSAGVGISAVVVNGLGGTGS